jgi:dihydroflavonol-4-reductase
VSDPQKDLVDPAVKGTLSILEASLKVGGIKRIVITSSFAAVTDSPQSGKIYTEKDWNTTSTLKRNPYYLSKTLAEKAATDFSKREDFKQTGTEIVFINPGLVIGPTYRNDVNGSVETLQAILNGGFPAIINLGWAMVDVRDCVSVFYKN